MNTVLIFLLMFLWRVAFEKFAMDKVRRKSVLILGAGIAGCDPMPMAVTVAPNPVAYVHPGATRPSQPGPVMVALADDATAAYQNAADHRVGGGEAARPGRER